MNFGKMSSLMEQYGGKKSAGGGVNKTTRATQGGVTAAIETDTNIVELDSENYGAPPENSGIAAYKHGMLSSDASDTEPQAWEDEKGNWFYNFAGAIRLAKVLGRTLPNSHQLTAAINANPDNFRQSLGYRHGGNGKFCGRGNFSGFWSSLENHDSSYAYCVFLEHGVSSSFRYWENVISRLYPSNFGLPVRFIKDKSKQ